MNPTAVLAGDAGLEGIQALVQGSGSRRRLRTALQSMLKPGCQFGPLRLTRVKYKPGRKLQAYYSVPFRDPMGSATSLRPIAVTWRTEKSSPESGEATGEPVTVEAMQAEAQHHGLLAPFASLQAFFPAQGSVIQVWPLDPEFPQLVRVSDPAYAPALFQAASLPELTRNSAVRILPVRYRPRERHVLRLELDVLKTEAGQSRVLYAKLYRDPESAARACRVAQTVVDWLDSNTHGFYGVRPLGISLEDSLVLYPHAPGIPLSQQLHRAPAWLAARLRLVGAVLATLHRGPETLTAELESVSLDKELRAIKRASEHVQVLLPEVGKSILALLDRAQERYARLPQEKPTFTHSDFKADHLLVSRAGMALIDFDTCALADPALDIGKFLADLDWWHDRIGLSSAAEAQQAFLLGYPEIEQNGRMDRARIFHALILVKIALRRAHLSGKHWAEITTHTIDKAKGYLA